MKEILQFNYWEHFKASKELSLVLPPEHPRRIALNESMDELLLKIHIHTTHQPADKQNK